MLIVLGLYLRTGHFVQLVRAYSLKAVNVNAHLAKTE